MGQTFNDDDTATEERLMHGSEFFHVVDVGYGWRFDTDEGDLGCD